MSAKMMSRACFLEGAGAVAALALCGTAGYSRQARADEAGDVRAYVAVEPSMKGDVTVVTAFEGDEIAAVYVVDEVDSTVIRDVAIADVCQRIVEGQNTDIDATAGATLTSNAILMGVREAVEAAGLEPSAFEKGSDSLASSDKKQGEDQFYDVVIAGSGMAGLTASIALARAGKRVLVLEKLAYTGGSTRLCGGGLWAMGTDLNKRIGQDCSLEDYQALMSGWSVSELNYDLMANIRQASSEIFDYLYDWGLPVHATEWSCARPEAAMLPIFWSTANIGMTYEDGESGLSDFMATRARLDGAEIRVNSKVTGLIVEDGVVVGVHVEDLGSVYDVRAGSVLLCTGGFTRNPDMVEKYAPECAASFPFTGAGSTGDGITMTEGLGVTVTGTGMMGLYGLNPNLGYYGPVGNMIWRSQVTVNAEGEPFGVEEGFYGMNYVNMLEQTGSVGYGIYDASNEWVEGVENAVAKGCGTKYDTLEELAADMGIDAVNLAATCAERGVSEAPFYCIVKRTLFTGSIPALKVSAHCEVLGEGDEPIPGLYAAGELIFGNIFDHAYPNSGSGVSNACYTGYVAGKAVLGA